MPNLLHRHGDAQAFLGRDEMIGILGILAGARNSLCTAMAVHHASFGLLSEGGAWASRQVKHLEVAWVPGVGPMGARQ